MCTKDQNSDENLRLLAAQRFLYSRAKRIKFENLIISILIAIVFPFIIVNNPSAKPFLTAFACMWTISSYFVLNYFSGVCIKSAAVIQEQFDTNVFCLSWNRPLVGKKVNAEEIVGYKNNYKGSFEKLKNWYSNLEPLSPKSVLILQRSSLMWDLQLRQAYTICIAIALALLFLSHISLSCFLDYKLRAYVFTLLIPASSLFLAVIQTAKNHYAQVSREQSLVNDIDAMLAASSPATFENCRQIQDIIFLTRCSDSLVPDYFYERLRKKFTEKMNEVNLELSESE